ncbi:DUF1080 domain-containing protein [Bacteroides sp. 519]|uniref:3-keto-disaccharide hydrolase n=1 Tax=Bacteroides sp. 519 TaxID=2302937 RepID=UPI0013D45128|nr:DUF1080 domain-containing protein [Bacteroides sp. 519]NDV59813.1 DUF1080 domain-containing protein [Bacteroides sp. 519]
MKTKLTLLAIVLLAISCTNKVEKEEWIPLFNGENLDGWTVKIRNYPVGENFGNTFRVEDGLLKVRYDAYDEFNDCFGHIYTNEVFSSYKLRVEYRFLGEQVKGAAGWAYRNNGVMFHSQSAESIHLNQDFPVSIEAQLLGGDGSGDRPTGSVCTPGTEVYIDNKPYKAHCYESNSKTYDGDQWVNFELVVYGDSLVHHIVEGDTVLTYTNLTVGGGNVSPTPDIPFGPLKKGHIALQSESHPTDFRKIEILKLD